MQRYRLDYEYDKVIGAHVTSVSDSHGYTSRAEYDYRYGLPTADIDLNGNAVRKRKATASAA